MSPNLNRRQEATHAGMLIVADRGYLERLAVKLRQGLALSRWCVPLLVAFATPGSARRRRYRALKSCAGLGISVSAALLSGCGSIAYPLKHYEAVYTKTALETPAPDPAALSRLDAARVERGRYLVEIAGCGACHTDGALIGEPSAARLLAGSYLGIAYTDPFRGTPGVAYPSNLTPDPRTGLGNWSDAQIAAAIRSGDLGSSAGHLIVMSWPLYQHMSDDDVNAVVMYLRRIPAIEHQVPMRVAPGTRATTPYVFFGVFRSGPALGIH
jgi:mono/diheme cytochrome c family protein